MLLLLMFLLLLLLFLRAVAVGRQELFRRGCKEALAVPVKLRAAAAAAVSLSFSLQQLLLLRHIWRRQHEE